MNKVHLMIQPKGGIGKSLTTSFLAQHQMKLSSNLLVIDIDQENPTLSQYKALKVQRLSVMDEARAIDPKLFDKLIIMIIEHPGDVIIDTGASIFSALMAYIVENTVFDIIQDSGKELIIHTIIGGGDTLYDTANGFADIAQHVDGNIVLWLNEHFGKLVSSNGVAIENARVITENKDKIIGMIKLIDRTRGTFGSDITKMATARMTFNEIDASDQFNRLEKNRLGIIRKAVFDQLDKLAIA